MLVEAAASDESSADRRVRTSATRGERVVAVVDGERRAAMKRMRSKRVVESMTETVSV